MSGFENKEQTSELDIGPGFDYECAACGHTWPDDGPEYTPITCAKCGNRLNVEIEGIGDLAIEQIGKRVGKYSWCGDCEKLTLNILGITYGSRPIEEHEPRGVVFREDGAVKVTKENMPELFFACEQCSTEKFWQWGDNCPRCDSDRHVIISIGKSRYNCGIAMEYGGDPYDWDENWLCLVCGHEYTIQNSSY